MTLYGHDFKHYMEVNINKEDTEQMAIVTNVKIINIRINDIIEYIYEELDPANNLRESSVRTAFEALDDVDKKVLATKMFIYRYCIHRVLTHYKVYKMENWQYHLTDDYYAQDVSSITLKPSIATEVDKSLKHMVSLKDSKMIEYTLNLEFKRVLPEVHNREWGIRMVHKDSLYFTNQTLYKKCLEEDLSYLDNYKLPRALCVKEKGPKPRYRVIDGYHRLAASIKNGDDRCLIIYC